jgi:hypothetical protein
LWLIIIAVIIIVIIIIIIAACGIDFKCGNWAVRPVRASKCNFKKPKKKKTQKPMPKQTFKA